MESGYLNI